MGMSHICYRSPRRHGACSGDSGAPAWALYLALTLTLSVYVWDYYWNYLRGALELATLSLLLLLIHASTRTRTHAPR